MHSLVFNYFHIHMCFCALNFFTASVTIFQPSSFFIIVQTAVGLQVEVQLGSVMQMYIYLEPKWRDQVLGLCGDYNNVQMDDFKVLSGVIEGTAASFGNTWKTQASCPNVLSYFDNPCSLSVENANYAQFWCSKLTDPAGPYAQCHSKVDPLLYKMNCMFDSCNYANSENYMCAALSSYVHACARMGVLITGWRDTNCNASTICPSSFSYSYNVTTCQPTCRSLSEPDVTCDIDFVPVDGCVCTAGTYLNEYGNCVPRDQCPCYFRGNIVKSGETVSDLGAWCTCTLGKLDCIGHLNLTKVCKPNKVYFDCTNQTSSTTGVECEKSCQTLDMNCYSAQCVSGCMCPEGFVANGTDDCIKEDQCPCVYNNDAYAEGSTITVSCKTCTCRNRIWNCTGDTCLGTCAVYGDGHYYTFDSNRYGFGGDCQYVLAQDYCEDPNNGTFRIITENIPCGSTGTTCSKSIRFSLGNNVLILAEEKFEVQYTGPGTYVPYKVHQMGIFLVIETLNGIVLVWDKKTTIYIKLQKDFQRKICGLCGNYDGSSVNDFTTRSLSVVSNVLEFADSWKQSSSCPTPVAIADSCTANIYRKPWAEKKCSVIIGTTFAACHAVVNPNPYYTTCVNDACACDTGGDCECLCTAIAAYAQACTEAGTCVSWRTPDFCPLFCDYYNLEGQCEWHYEACGAPCMKTCRNPTGLCYYKLMGLEGCYPVCPPDRPYFDEERMTCVRSCCFDKIGKNYLFGQVMPREAADSNCTICVCTRGGRQCFTDTGCCKYDTTLYTTSQPVYCTSDGLGGSVHAICENGTITRFATDSPCTETTSSTTTTHTTTTTHPTTTTSMTTTTTHPTTTTTTESTTTTTSMTTTTTTSPTTSTTYPTTTTTSPTTTTTTTHPTTTSHPTTTTTATSTTITTTSVTTITSTKTRGCTTPSSRLITSPGAGLGTSPGAGHTNSPGVGLTNSPGVGLTNSPGVGLTNSPGVGLNNSPGVGLTNSPGLGLTNPPGVGLTDSPGVGLATSPEAPSYTYPDTSPWCTLTPWIDVSYPKFGGTGDDESFDNIRKNGISICNETMTIMSVDCRAKDFPDASLDDLKQTITCNKDVGLICLNSDNFPICFNYEIQIQCCSSTKAIEITTEIPTETSEIPIKTTLTPIETTEKFLETTESFLETTETFLETTETSVETTTCSMTTTATTTTSPTTTSTTTHPTTTTSTQTTTTTTQPTTTSPTTTSHSTTTTTSPTTTTTSPTTTTTRHSTTTSPTTTTTTHSTTTTTSHPTTTTTTPTTMTTTSVTTITSTRTRVSSRSYCI
ncbi:mucin-5AC-like [Xenopus laevis]|uniref:Mucin-5AC-like n=1 Tax=Xenopus laevis TaxID=8355 RepID=A0A8J1KKK0_XENLA|nr:mucin-5AC-like [Xenopus laevis]